jgi:hypothetical protein
MTKVGDAYLALLDGMTTVDPVCKDDALFTADNHTKEDAEFMATLCNGCPLVSLCKEYARLERPKAGFWAGKQYKTTTKADPE